MKEDKKVPQLRFPEFTDAWKQRKVGDLLVERREMVTEDNEYPLMAFIANEGVAPKGDRFDRSALVKNADSKKYKRTKYGDFIYSSNNLESGSIGLNKYGKASISPVYSIFYPTNLADSDFIGRYFLRKDFIGQMIRWRQGVVYGQWKIPEADFLNIDIYIPSKDEQEKIGQILDKVDNTITLQQRKLNSLQKLKKGLLQKMFPKNGENIPEIRFPEFSDAWKQRKFSEVFEEYSEKKHPELPALTIIQGKGTILRDASDRNLLYDKANLTSYKLVRKDDFIVHLRTFEGGFEKANSDGIVSPAYHIFHGKNTDTRFFYPFFRSKYFIDALLKPHVYGIRDGKSIDIEGMKTISFLVPSFEEQNKIGKFVETLDNTITLQQRKLESLQKLKKGLLQQMFI